ncbi:hypothetical protein [Natrialbaceae archaeon AArc-T1-2]|uniref:hypothetical protein n=1 Tax=Natrialbaceae archaeon AArc-T1-2 TaxID=3053904 RepID=UPI00255AFA64|nr:hypothetical protein [Natrialbaceae archaeon AArc-T1-2]WIV67820.1 hypothetical protein QQ977_03560 [Natrialbaceae archaeon AArc-T1-2]
MYGRREVWIVLRQLATYVLDDESPLEILVFVADGNTPDGVFALGPLFGEDALRGRCQ